MMKINPPAQRFYPEPHDLLELIACQLANVVGIVVGIGAISLLRDRLGFRFWMAEAAVGALGMAVGLFFLERHTPRLLPFVKNLFSIFRRLPGHLRRAWAWFRSHLPDIRKESPRPVPVASPGVPESPPAAALPAAPPSVSADVVPARTPGLLPAQTLLIGLVILLSAALAACLHYFWAKSLGQVALAQVAIYFSAPALLIWVIGEIPHIVPKISVKPWDASTITAILKSGLQALAALLVWVYLALALVRKEQLWLLPGGLGLALGGLVFGISSIMIARQRERARLQTTHQELEATR